MSYVQLWTARELATQLPRPLRCYLKQNNDSTPTPSTVQRNFQRIISEIGEPVLVTLHQKILIPDISLP